MTDVPKGKAAVTVRIGGEDHVIRAKVEPEYTVRCARLVDSRITEIRSHVGLIEKHKAAILAALSITDELFQTKKELEKMREMLGRRLGAQADLLERSVEEHAGK
ncbi:cell division protein ZapA [Gemmatimonadota bacterium]